MQNLSELEMMQQNGGRMEKTPNVCMKFKRFEFFCLN